MKTTLNLSKCLSKVAYLFGLLLMFQACKSAITPQRTQVSDRTVNSSPARPSETAPSRPSTAPPKPSSYFKPLEVELAPSKREFRGVWIATVANIDWPSAPTDPYSKQKEDFIKILDYYQSLNFNAVIVQIRTSGDAFYPSKYAPWSRYLTGKEGQKPNTQEDPLAWMILEAHKRGMEFHAWLNPYRATMNLDTKLLSPEHDLFKYPNWMIKYDTKYYYNPGLPEVRAHLINVIREVVQNYNIDAIHFDDYFYPYKVPKLEFGDSASFKKYGKPGQKLDDWRRENVNILVKEINQVIKTEKPWVQFGISPFGVWRNKDKDPNGSNTRAGQTNYDDLYADVLTWMKNGWIDYLIPQLYWSMDYNLASYRELVNWWSKNSYNTKIYIGNGPYKIRDNTDKAWDNPMEIPNQVGYSKNIPNMAGNAYFSAKSMYQKNRDVADLLLKTHYTRPVLTPDMQSLGTKSPEIKSPNLIPHSGGWAFDFGTYLNSDLRFALVYTGSSIQELQQKNDKTTFQKILLEEKNRQLLPFSSNGSHRYIALSFLDRFGRESKPMVFELLQGRP